MKRERTGGTGGTGGTPPQGQPARPVRADARRNIDALLDAATAVFLAAGVDAPVRAIADRAGVGIGTVYRHFPRRADLIAAVFRHEVDACADAAAALAARHGPADALVRWVGRYADLIRAKRGLAAALHSGDPAYAALPGHFEGRLLPALAGLLDAAAAAGAVRRGVDPADLLWAVASLCGSQRDPDPASVRRMIGFLLDGLRYGVTPPRTPPRTPSQAAAARRPDRRP